MKGKRTIYLLLFLSLLVPAVSNAADSAQSANLSVYPAARLFPALNSGQVSSALVFTVKNSNATTDISLDTLSLGGVNPTQFALAGADDHCSNTTLAANGGSCTASVKFQPTSSGKKSAILLIPSNDAETPTLTAFITNYEATTDQARRRMPPVLSAISIPETMNAGQTYTLTWSEEGYNADYSTNIAVFDCTGISDGTCGANYTDGTKFAESGNSAPVSTATGNWQYNGVTTTLFNYSWDFAVPAKRSGGSDWSGSNNIVIRFYTTNNVDAARSNSSISLLVPGNLTNVYYDTAGRRIVKTIAP